MQVHTGNKKLGSVLFKTILEEVRHSPGSDDEYKMDRFAKSCLSPRVFIHFISLAPTVGNHLFTNFSRIFPMCLYADKSKRAFIYLSPTFPQKRSRSRRHSYLTFVTTQSILDIFSISPQCLFNTAAWYSTEGLVPVWLSGLQMDTWDVSRILQLQTVLQRLHMCADTATG